MLEDRPKKRPFEISEKLERYIQSREEIARSEGALEQAGRSKRRVVEAFEAHERGNLIG